MIASDKNKISVGMLSLGCPKTLVDSELVLGRLNPQRYHIASHVSECDIAFVNTCTFIDASKKESIDHILDLIELKREGKIKALVILGCLVQRYSQELASELKEVDAFLGTGEYDKVNEIVDVLSSRIKPAAFTSELKHYEPFTSIGRHGFLYAADHARVALTPAHYRYVKISEGCDHHCSFCTIPSFRGKHRSRALRDIILEVKQLAERGCREVVLTGQDTTHYGKDITNQFMLAELLRELSQIDQIDWIRVLYAYPLFVNKKLIESIAETPKVCHYLDMPLQHISDSILTSMKRGVSKERTMRLIQDLRARIPDLAIRTTFIVGYPGETESNFNELLEFIEWARFERAGVFMYSQEEGTPAGDLKNQISKGVKKDRFDRAMKLQQSISRQLNNRWIGKTLDVMIDEAVKNKDQLFIGRSYMDAPEVDGSVMVFANNGRLPEVGHLVKVRIHKAQEYDLFGDLIS